MSAEANGSRRNRAVFVVALTGGIASGKTSVSRQFAELGVPVIDTDVIARELVQCGSPALKQISDAFGPDILNSKGALKRRQLRNLIFSNPEKREVLERILHPEIRRQAWQCIDALDNGYCILVIPLLAEKGGYLDVDRVLVVDVSEQIQLERLSTRDDVSKEQARTSLAAQASRAQRLEIADDIINNSGPESDLDGKVRELHEFYLYLASRGSD